MKPNMKKALLICLMSVIIKQNVLLVDYQYYTL